MTSQAKNHDDSREQLLRMIVLYGDDEAAKKAKEELDAMERPNDEQ